MCSSGDSRRAEADATDGDALPGFHSWGAEAALSLFARESSGTALRRGAVRGLVLDAWRARRRVGNRLLVSYTASKLSAYPKTRRSRSRHSSINSLRCLGALETV